MTEIHSRANSKILPEQGSNYFPTLMTCMALSIALLWITRIAIDRSAGALPNWLSIFAGVLPLIYYHVLYLRPRVKELNQAAIDSVYYYGFLVTLVALGLSAFSMVTAQQGVLLVNPGTVIAQFGVGLFATGYAIFARLHLISYSQEFGDSSPDVIIDRYVNRSRQLVEQLDITLHSFKELAQKSEAAIQSIERVSRESVQHNSAALKAVAEGFKSEMDQVFARTKDSLTEVRGMVSDVSFVEERKLFARNIKAISEGTSHLNEEMQNLSKACQDSALATKSFSSENQTLSESIGRFAEKLNTASKGVEALASELERTEKKISLSTDELKRQIGESSRAMSDDVQRATAASALLASKIIEIAEIVIERTKKT